MALVVYTNVLRPVRQRAGLAAKNSPEKRQELIIKAIQGYFEESTIFTSSQFIPPDWLEKCGLHDPKYLDFLEQAHASWNQTKDPDWEEGNGLVPHEFFKRLNKNTVLYKQAGFYGLDTMTPIYEDTFRNAMIAAGRAYTAATDWAKDPDKVYYVLACSPGHHAKHANYGGYCFLNNALIAAYRFGQLKIQEGKLKKPKIAILDLDYHAGNGTAEIVASKKGKFPVLDSEDPVEIIAVSLHADPTNDYPSNEGFEDDYPDDSNVINVPLKGGTEIEGYLEALKRVLFEDLKPKGLAGLVIAFGADTFKDDPDTNIKGRFSITLEDYTAIAETITSTLSLPTLVTQEGGYNLEATPDILCRFLDALGR